MAKKKAQQPRIDLPRFLVQHTKDEMFNFCMEINGSFQCWSSAYPPSMDSRFKREIKKGPSLPISAWDKETKGVKIWDKGSYSIAKNKTKADIEKAFLDGLSKNKLSFLLTGDKVEGRFIIHYNKNTEALLLYKQKDKFQKEEDPLETELQRSMNKWVPKYDPDKAELPKLKKRTAAPVATRAEESEPDPSDATPTPVSKKPPVSKKQPTPAKTKQRQHKPDKEEKKQSGSFKASIKSTSYRFDLYTPFDGALDNVICLVTPPDGTAFVMKPAGEGEWEIISTVNIDVARKESLFSAAILEALK